MNDQKMVGHYRVVELLGSGAMGDVHVGVDTFIDRAVAIKSLRPEFSHDPDFVSRFRAEAASLARLNHPNITTLYSPLFEGERLYIVMELVRGQPLDEIMKSRGKPLGVKESLAIIAQAADGLGYAHEIGVIHRDIKPSNLMVSNDGRLKIMDFGIARVQGSVRLTKTGTAVGTPLYMSPEQCKGEEGDERSDLYSLAIVLYEMLSGAPPFTGKSEYELIKAQVGAIPAPLIPRVPGVTHEIERAIMTALEKRPELRFPNVRAFSDALGATALRIDATAVIRNATHLIESAEESPADEKASTRAFAVLRSRFFIMLRRFAGLPLYAQLGAGAATLAALAFLANVLLSAPPNESKRSAIADSREATPVARQGDAGVAEKTPIAVASPAKAGNDAADADLSELRKAWKAKDFENAFGIAQRFAASDNSEIQYILGMLYLKTAGHQDFKAAFNYLKRSAEQNYAEAQTALGKMYQNGDAADGEPNLPEAVHWYSKAAEQNDPKGQFLLGQFFEHGWGGLKKDPKKAEDFYRKASMQGYDEATEAMDRLSKPARRRR